MWNVVEIHSQLTQPDVKNEAIQTTTYQPIPDWQLLTCFFHPVCIWLPTPSASGSATKWMSRFLVDGTPISGWNSATGMKNLSQVLFRPEIDVNISSSKSHHQSTNYSSPPPTLPFYSERQIWELEKSYSEAVSMETVFMVQWKLFVKENRSQRKLLAKK